MKNNNNYFYDNDPVYVEHLNNSLIVSNMLDYDLEINLPEDFEDGKFPENTEENKIEQNTISLIKDENCKIKNNNLINNNTFYGDTHFILRLYPNFSRMDGIKEISWKSNNDEDIKCEIISTNQEKLADVQKGKEIKEDIKLQKLDIKFTLTRGTVIETIKIKYKIKKTLNGIKIPLKNIEELETIKKKIKELETSKTNIGELETSKTNKTNIEELETIKKKIKELETSKTNIEDPKTHLQAEDILKIKDELKNINTLLDNVKTCLKDCETEKKDINALIATIAGLGGITGLTALLTNIGNAGVDNLEKIIKTMSNLGSSGINERNTPPTSSTSGDSNIINDINKDIEKLEKKLDNFEVIIDKIENNLYSHAINLPGDLPDEKFPEHERKIETITAPIQLIKKEGCIIKDGKLVNNNNLEKAEFTLNVFPNSSNKRKIEKITWIENKSWFTLRSGTCKLSTQRKKIDIGNGENLLSNNIIHEFSLEFSFPNEISNIIIEYENTKNKKLFKIPKENIMGLKEELEELKNTLKDINDKEDQLQSKNTEVKKEVGTIKNNIVSYEGKLNVFQGQINDIGTNLNKKSDKLTKEEELDKYYPIGSIYMNTNNTNPKELFGGIWEQISGRFLLGSGKNYLLESTGGEALHKLTIDEMPSHSHNLTLKKSTRNSEKIVKDENNPRIMHPKDIEAQKEVYETKVENTGKDNPHNNMPPYHVVNIWKRTR